MEAFALFVGYAVLGFWAVVFFLLAAAAGIWKFCIWLDQPPKPRHRAR